MTTHFPSYYDATLMILEGDCHDSSKHKHRCVTGAIYNYTMQLKSVDAGSELNCMCMHLQSAFFMFLVTYEDMHFNFLFWFYQIQIIWLRHFYSWHILLGMFIRFVLLVFHLKYYKKHNLFLVQKVKSFVLDLHEWKIRVWVYLWVGKLGNENLKL